MVPDVVVTSTSLETIPPRPPTPPREKPTDPHKQNEKQLLARPSLDPRRSLQTPPDYSPYSSDLSNPTSRRTRKKVGFSSQADYSDAPSGRCIAGTPASTVSTASPAQPLKSILKPSPPTISNPLDPSAGTDEATRNATITTMLESTTKQLAGADRASKLDAYSMLVRALKTSNNLPDRIALQDKMGLFTQFIQRDLTMVHEESKELDSSLSNHASTLLITFLNFPAIASSISNDFRVFIIDHCIRSFDNATVPKDVVRHLMQVVASQDFPPKVMTSDRVGRLVSSLHRIEEHMKGKSIIMSRILIYRRLIKQSKPHMVVHSDWLLDLFTDLLSSIKEIRASAIALGLEASFSIAKEKQLSRRVMEILELAIDETKYIQYYAGRLKTMLKSKDKNECMVVPQIWSVIILLMRCPVTKWDFFGPWLEIMQLCFNHADLQTKLEANYAWNRLVYCMQLNDQSFAKIIATIRQPYESQLRRKKLSDELRKVVIGSLCNLYYYSFKPNTSSDHISNFWDSCVPQLMAAMVSPATNSKKTTQTQSAWPDQLPQAIQIMAALLNSTTPRIWKEDRIADSPLVKFAELPALDPKWVRRNASKVFSVLEPMLTKTFLDLADPTSATARLWRSLVNSVALAASKEIKVSSDTAVFMAHAFTFLLRIWSHGLSGLTTEDQSWSRFYDAVATLVNELIGSLGILPFTERQLSIGNQNTFLPVATPSHRAGKSQGMTRTPLLHLFSILSSLPGGAPDDESLLDLLRTIFTPLISTKPPKARVELGRELMDCMPMGTLSPFGPWIFVSEIFESSVEVCQTSESTLSAGSQPPVGPEYREFVKHLERGLRSTPKLPRENWLSLYNFIASQTIEETGEAGCAIALIEPMAKCVLDLLGNKPSSGHTIYLFLSGIGLISDARYPRDKAAIDAARRRLWGTSISGSRSATFDPFDHLYKLINHLLVDSYQHYQERNSSGVVAPLLNEVATFLAKCNKLLVFKSLVHLQTGIGLWIQDKEVRYSSRQSPHVSDAVKSLWNCIRNIFILADNLDQVQLDTIEPLLCSAFESRHKHIVNGVAVMWNQAFCEAEEVIYPEKLKATLLSLRPHVDIVLPGIDVSSLESSGLQPQFIDSQDETDAAVSSITPAHKATPPIDRRLSSRRSKSNTPTPIQLSVANHRSVQSTPTSALTKTRRGAAARLRHDDSQIQFAAIESSSPIRINDESQVLTERQKEIKERQRNTAALFPEMRSSGEVPSKKQQEIDQDDGPDESQNEKIVTPKSHRSFEDYVSSTPTPRRGQASLIDENDQEMTDDIPSSPPDPRRYPLVPEIIQAQSSSSSVLDEWQFTSSPISGSPRIDQTIASVRQVKNNHANQQSLVDNSRMLGIEKAAPIVSDDDCDHADIEDEGSDAPMIDNDPVGPVLSDNHQKASTPPNARSIKVQETPKSDHEVFVDALTSPEPQTPRAQRALARAAQAAAVQTEKAVSYQNPSFDASDVDERSLLRLVVELDSRKCSPLPDGPERRLLKASHAGLSDERGGSPVLDCITVSADADESRKSDDSRLEATSSVIPSTPFEASSSRDAGRKFKRKRKRTSDTSEEANSRKRRSSQDNKRGAGAVPSSQLTQANDSASLELFETSGGERQTSSSQESFANRDDETTEVPLAYTHGDVDTSIDELEAVNLQIVQEASQNTDQGAAAELETMGPVPAAMEIETSTDGQNEGVVAERDFEDAVKAVSVDQVEVPKATFELSPMEKIMEALKAGLTELRTATLTRDEVNKVEDMFMDMKRELYGAELRGRK
ncbi:hypothetical protein PFICI_07146 [Pestalotiopsis fici W106-1]|uniref:Telomere-associated protein Rif1 N-terminal domain-containing protein n=1 Tax=Pestalotiopsis fici (strain W106-1 / CGMCC3.15140) TaxID=1229662 RepID=W3X7Y4_PESFW|nr:uncharacterized protein PFICI_07146 [Pestalotiopsis fici W106-1]ETS82144.1 hypothetical protein PFICI_07146 [Pestalotiopsis fici W106-1]